MRPPTTRNELRDNKASGLAVAAAGTENKTSGGREENYYSFAARRVYRAGYTNRMQRVWFTLAHAHANTRFPLPVCVCVYLDAPLIVIRSII